MSEKDCKYLLFFDPWHVDLWFGSLVDIHLVGVLNGLLLLHNLKAVAVIRIYRYRLTSLLPPWLRFSPKQPSLLARACFLNKVLHF